jgi:BirA family biotin operon repressor/biotin-[acetyl-CoA-carboxylase] ligase
MPIGSEIIRFDSTTSTNNYASALLHEGSAGDGTVIRAGFQTGGRGQEGNTWESERDKNLLISIILFPEKILPSDQFSISMAVSVALVRFLSRYLQGVRIKWPNDIYFRDDKIAGILMECAISGNRISHAIAGLGLNVNQTIFAGTAPNPVSMKLITGIDYDVDAVMRELITDLDRSYASVLKEGRRAVEDEYLGMLYRKDQWHRFSAAGKEFIGMITGIDDTGCLVVTGKSGTRRSYMFKEIVYL